jgi:acetolactate synthase-1/2/3 large subunit
MPMMTGARYLATTLKGYGVTHVFFVPAVLLKTCAEMEDLDIRRIVTHGEKAAAYMADGYARASGKPGICFAQNIGASNLAAGLRDPYMAGAPVIAMTGGPTAATRHRNYYQEIEDLSQFDPVTKFNAEVEDVTRLPDLLRQAFRAATSGAPGPVHLRFPGAAGDAFEDKEADLPDIVEARFSQVPAFRIEPDQADVAKAAELLTRARQPIIVAGGGVVTSNAMTEVLALAEALSIPVATSLNAKGTILDTHPLSVGVVGTYSRSSANRAVHEADLVFFIGSHTGGQVTSQWTLPARGTPVIPLDIDPLELGRNYPNAASILGDAQVTLCHLLKAVAGKPIAHSNSWLERIRELVAEWRAQEEPMLTSSAVPMRPERICKAISDMLPADGVVVSDTGHSGIWSGTMIDFLRPGQRYIRCAGSLGWALPGAIGVKCALPNKPVVCFAGDGAVYYHIAELETAARYGINIVLVVNNNSALNQEIALYDRAYGGKQRGRADEMWRFREVDFAKIAEGFGCHGIRVEDPADLNDAIAQALKMNKPVVLDAVTDTYAIARRAWAAPKPS